MQRGKKFSVETGDEGTLIEALAMVDRYIHYNPEESVFPIYEGYIHHYLQLFIDLEQEIIYDDVGISAYGPDKEGTMRKFNPVRENINFNLYPNSLIHLQPDVGC